LVGGVLADMFSITTPFLFMVVVNLIGFAATLILLQEAPRKVAPREHRSPFAPLKSRVLRGVFSYRLTAGLGTSTLLAFMPLFADVHMGLSTTLIGIMLAARAPVSFLQSFTGSLADKYSRRMMVILGALVAVVAMALLPTARQFWPLLFTYMFIGLGQSISLPASTAYVVEEGRTYGMGTSMTMFMMAMQLGNGMGPVALGALADATNLKTIFYAAAVIMFLGMLVFLTTVRRKPSATDSIQANT
jgi:predicted MFS family arabinose efflux permease